jgi:hypothetical protein
MYVPGERGYSFDVTIRQKVGFVIESRAANQGYSMNRVFCRALLTFACGVPAVAAGQTPGLPTSQPALVTIIREEVKVGRTAEHARIEAGWPAAFGRANSPDYYLALTSITGMPEAWYLLPAANHAAQGESLKRYDNDAAMTAELERLSRADAEVLNSIRTIQAVARPDLSHGPFPNLAKQRFWEISIFRVRPGHEQEFDAAAKAYASAAERAGPHQAFRVFQVIAGMVGPTYLIFSSVESYDQFDQMMAEGMQTMQGATPAEQAALQKFSTDGMINAESNRFRLDPKQSYVSRETRATDPTFWGTMPTASRVTPRRP